MLLRELVDVSNAVAGARGRLDKIGKLAQLLKRLLPGEIPIAVAYLSGSLPQGRIGIGWSVIRRAGVPTGADNIARDAWVHDTFQVLEHWRCRCGTRAGKASHRLFSRATESARFFVRRSRRARRGSGRGMSKPWPSGRRARGGVSRQRVCGDLGEVASTALGECVSALSDMPLNYSSGRTMIGRPRRA